MTKKLHAESWSVSNTQGTPWMFCKKDAGKTHWLICVWKTRGHWPLKDKTGGIATGTFKPESSPLNINSFSSVSDILLSTGAGYNISLGILLLVSRDSWTSGWPSLIQSFFFYSLRLLCSRIYLSTNQYMYLYASLSSIICLIFLSTIYSLFQSPI